jgi:hypothetical protein
LVAIAAAACAGPQVESTDSLTELAPPTAAGAMAPSLAVDGDDLLLSWLEPGYRFLVARLHDGRWGPAVLIAESEGFFANWADVPKVGVAGDGTLWSHWLAKSGSETYAYGISVARSTDGGSSWQAMGSLHDDNTPTEHGFVAYAPEGTGLRAVWLDGREMATGGPMTLRSARLDEAIGPAAVIDDRVCECCPTALAATARGAVAFYRDRAPDEVRNIGVSRWTDGTWSAPQPLHADGWQLSGCPVNGPAVDAAGEELAVAWFTAAAGRPRVQLAFSHDAGVQFDEPIIVDGERPLGRVSLALETDGSAWVSWLAVSESAAEIKIARFAATGLLTERTVAVTGASRASGIPRLARAGDRLYIAWVETEDDQPGAVHLATWAASSAPAGD